MNQLPKISIVTPSFNQGQFIEETICSVLDQNYPNLEYIIIDGGSTDNSVELIKKYEKHLKYWVSEPDRGQSHAINKGLIHCTGEVFNWLNSDDLLVPGALEIIGAHFLNPKVEVLSGRELHFNESEEWIKYGSIIYDELEKNLLDGVIYQPSTFWRLDQIKEVLPLNNELNYLMDVDLWIRYFAMKGLSRSLKIEAPLAKFRLHQGSKTVNEKQKFNEERELIVKSILIDLGQTTWSLFYENETNLSRKLRPIRIDQNIRMKRILAICGSNLVEKLYSTYRYKDLKKLYLKIILQGVYFDTFFTYFYRVFLIPKCLLNKLRNRNVSKSAPHQ